MEGLAENRPSVLVGDFILVKHSGESNDQRWFKGCVHTVMADQVSLRFNDSFSTYKGTKFDVRFVLNRLPFRRMHQAITIKVDSSRYLFPELERVRAINAQPEPLTPFNRLVGENHEQSMAVAAIVNQPPGSVPFVIFGP